MTETATMAPAPVIDTPTEEVPTLEIDQCPVCLTKEAQVQLYIGTKTLDYIRRVWHCLNCSHEWPRQPEDTAK